MFRALEFESNFLEIEYRFSQNNFHLSQKCKTLNKHRGRQRGTTSVNNFPRKIIVESILSVIANARNRVWQSKENIFFFIFFFIFLFIYLFFFIVIVLLKKKMLHQKVANCLVRGGLIVNTTRKNLRDWISAKP